jgi:hypothetical protein
MNWDIDAFPQLNGSRLFKGQRRAGQIPSEGKIQHLLTKYLL